MAVPDLGMLRASPLFAAMDGACIAEAAAAMDYRRYENGAVVFNEDDPGHDVYFILSGAVEITKTLEGGNRFKTLAVLGEGSFFGEMAVLSGAGAPRSARAAAEGALELAVINGHSLIDILEKHPHSAVTFMREMLAALSGRLRKTSGELAMVYDIGALAFVEFEDERQFAGRLLDEALMHFGKGWSCGFYVYDYMNEELPLVATRGAAFGEPQGIADIKENRDNFWHDERTYVVVLPGEERPDGFVIFVSETALSIEGQRSLAVPLSTLGFFSNAIVDNIRHHRENMLRQRLMQSRHHN
jgi:CRP-like cAMP-binding protein